MSVSLLAIHVRSQDLGIWEGNRSRSVQFNWSAAVELCGRSTRETSAGTV